MTEDLRLKLAPFKVEHACHYEHDYAYDRALCGNKINRYDFLPTRSRNQVVTCRSCRRIAERRDA